MASAITNVRVFDGEKVHIDQTVLIDDGIISAVGPARSLPVPEGTTAIDGSACTLLPGLIDAHTHTSEPSLKLALKFGVTTELEMSGQWTAPRRQAVKEDDTSADLRTAMQHISPPGGHPEELLRKIPPSFWLQASMQNATGPGEPSEKTVQQTQGTETQAHQDQGHSHGPGMGVSTPEEAETHVARCVKDRADYIKVMIEDGCVLGEPGLPMLSETTLRAAVAAAHKHGKMVIAHALTYESTRQALEVGVDGLAHLFIDRAIDDEMVELMKTKKVFVTACACLNASTMNLRTPLLDDERVISRLPPEWSEALASPFDTYRQGQFAHVLESIRTLHSADVDVLVGTDSSVPLPHFGGIAHGASVHHELQLFVDAGLSPVEALKAATSVPARRFGLDDRGKVAQGLRADLLLVEGDPTSHIQDTLNIKAIWRRGRQVSS